MLFFHFSFRSYPFRCLLTPSSYSPTLIVITSKHIKRLRALISRPLKDRNFFDLKSTNLSIIKILQLNVYLVKQMRVKATDTQLFKAIKILQLYKSVVKRMQS